MKLLKAFVNRLRNWLDKIAEDLDPYIQLEKEMDTVEWPEDDITYEHIPTHWDANGKPIGWTVKPSRERTYMDVAINVASLKKDDWVREILIRRFENDIRKAINELRKQGKIKTNENQ